MRTADQLQARLVPASDILDAAYKPVERLARNVAITASQSNQAIKVAVTPTPTGVEISLLGDGASRARDQAMLGIQNLRQTIADAMRVAALNRLRG